MMRVEEYSSIRLTYLAVGFAIFFVMHPLLCCDVFLMMLTMMMIIILVMMMSVGDDAFRVRVIIKRKIFTIISLKDCCFG